MKTALLKYTSVFFVYFTIDLTYQITFGMQFSQRIQEEAGIKEIVASEIQNPILILIWFAIMTTAIVKLAVEPAVEAKSIKKAVHKGVLLGVTSYATLALPNGWSLANYPLALVFEITMEGVVFAPVASGVTAWWLLKKPPVKNGTDPAPNTHSSQNEQP